MPKYRVVVTEINEQVDVIESIANPKLESTEVYSQTLPELNLPAFVRALNQPVRQRRTKKEVKP